MKAEVCAYLMRNGQWFRPISILSPVFGLEVECMGNGDCNQQPPRISRSYFLLSPKKAEGKKSLNLKKKERGRGEGEGKREDLFQSVDLSKSAGL